MIYGYVRCSTNEERQDITRQEREIKCLVNKKINKIYREYESGTNTNRAELNSLLDRVKEGDTIVCTEVSRISRSTKQLCEIIELAKDKKLKLIFGNFVVDCTKELDPMTEGMLKMMGVFSEIERNMISQRVKSGMINAREKGAKIGRPKTQEENIPNVFKRSYELYKSGAINKTELARITNLSRPSVNKYLNILEEN